MGDGNFRPPENKHPLTDHQKIWYRCGPYGWAKFGSNPSMGGFWANGWNITKFFFIFIFSVNSPTGQTRRRIFTLDGSNDADSRKNVTFGGFVDIAPHFRGEIPRKTQFLGREYAFSSQTGKILKVSCFRSYCIDFNQILHNDRDPQVVVACGPNRRPRNPRWRTAAMFKKKLNRHISATVWPILMKFGTVTHIGLLQRNR